MVEVWEDMEKALSRGASSDDDQLQDDDGGGGDDRDRLHVQCGRPCLQIDSKLTKAANVVTAKLDLKRVGSHKLIVVSPPIMNVRCYQETKEAYFQLKTS
jgi:hypothetical protein